MNFDYLKEKIFGILGFEYEGEIEFKKTDGVLASLCGGKALIGGENESCVCRALTEFAKCVKEGKSEFEIELKQHFRWCGPMLDMSRFGVMRAEKVCEYINFIASLGMNMIMLYTEETFEIESRPFFGYKRGRYTEEELKKIDDYAYSLGVEVIPCVQTLGHLESYLQWAEAGEIRDTGFNIMPEGEKTYEFIEDVLKTTRKVFRSDNIHIGMDEAVDVGKGAYFSKHRGEVINQSDIIIKHLWRVCELCEKYNYKPMIWSDLFFGISAPDECEIFTYNMYISEENKKRLPDNIRLMYWYYSSQKKERYLQLLKRHKESGRDIAFAGAGWNWEGFAPNHKFTFDTMVPALEACAEENCDLLLNTLWGCGGCETSYFLCFPSNALFAEYMYKGKDAEPEKAWEYSELVYGLPKSVYDNMDVLNFGLYGNQILGRKLLRCDVLGTQHVADGFVKENMPRVFDGCEPMKSFKKAAGELLAYDNENDSLLCRLEAAALNTAALKAYIYTNLQKAYKEKNKSELEKIAYVVLPECRKSYDNLYSVFEKQWENEFKWFGWETHCSLYGFQLTRIDYAIKMLTRYLNGEISEIEELEAETINQNVREYDSSMFD